MRILSVIISPPFSRESGGLAAGLHLSKATSNLVDIEAAVMADQTKLDTSDHLRIHFFSCHSVFGRLTPILPRQLRSLLWRCNKISQFIGVYKPDLVHFHNPHPAGALWKLCGSCVAEKIPYVISGHGFVEMSNFSSTLGVARWKRPLVWMLVTRPFRCAVKNATHVFLTSPFEKQIVADLGVSPERQSIVTNGVNPFYLQPADTEMVRKTSEHWGIIQDVPSFLFVGNHTFNKGIDVLLKAAHKVKIPLRIFIAGRIRSREEHSLLRRRYHVDELQGQVVFTDVLDDLELRALYQAVSAFVFPSRADTLPLVVLEAMASGLPVISTNVGGIPYQVTSETGILVPPNNSDALAQAMMEMANDPKRRILMGAAGRKRVQECFNWEQSAKTAATLYHRIFQDSTLVKS
jgi:glycosyltransferase involved in cell wall biosynthesis